MHIGERAWMRWVRLKREDWKVKEERKEAMGKSGEVVLSYLMNAY